MENKFDRRNFIKKSLEACGCGIMFSCMPNSVKAQEITSKKKPNIILIYTDDQAFYELGCYGGNVLTPNIDGLAANGLKFERFYVSSPVCSPSRYSLLTGKYASRSGSLLKSFPAGGPVNMGWESGVGWGPVGSETTLAHILKSKGGYRTGMVGKWMQGFRGAMKKVPADADPSDPQVRKVLEENYDKQVKTVKECGFDYAASVYQTNVGNPLGSRDTTLPKALRYHNMEWITEGAIKFIEQSKEQPFFLYMATTLPHGPSSFESLKTDPRFTPSGVLEKAPDVQPSRENVIKRTQNFAKKSGQDKFIDKIAGSLWVDDSIGSLLAKLEELGLTDNTVIIFASDNGKRGKFTCYDAGGRMPLLVSWPSVIKHSSTCNDLVSNVDIAPTILDICGVKITQDMQMDGKSFFNILLGKPYSRSSLFLEITTERAVVTDDYFKYIAVRYPKEIQQKIDVGEVFTHWCLPISKAHHTYNAEKDYPSYFDMDQLYNLKNDPKEQNNLASLSEYKSKLETMQTLLKEYCEKLPHTFGEFKK